MYCKWCGMESKDDKRCDWCGRPFVTPVGEQATTAVPPGAPQPTAQAPQATTAMPPFDETVRPPLPYNPNLSPERPFQIERVELPSFGDRISKYMGTMLILLAVGMLVISAVPSIWLLLYLPLLFVSGLMMGTTRTIGYYEEEYTDVVILLGITAFVGPVCGTIALLVYGLIRSDLNIAALGLMASFFVIRISTGVAAHGWADTLGEVKTIRVALEIIGWAIQLMPLCALFGGWMIASFWRPLNE